VTDMVKLYIIQNLEGDAETIA